MYFTQALTVALSLSAAAVNAAPAPIVAPKNAKDGMGGLIARSVPESRIAARDVSIPVAIGNTPLQARSLDPVAHLQRSLDVKFGHLKPEARDLAMVTELHRRGLLDQLVAALRDLILTLLGSGGGMTRRQASTDQIQQAIQQITCILDALFGNADDSCTDILGGSATNATNPTSAVQSSLEKGLSQLGAQIRNSSSITQVVNSFMPNVAGQTTTTTAAKTTKSTKESSGKNHSNVTSVAHGTAASAKDSHDKRSVHMLVERQQFGLEGLLVALRDVVDTILNTLLPMSSRDEDSSSSATSSSGKWPPQDCPPPTPNDGMYRPGCPGYGRRDLAVRRSMQDLGERDANVLQAVMPMIEMLLRAIPQLIESVASNSASSAAATATSAGAKASPTSGTDDAFSQIMSALGYGSSSSSGKSSNKASSSSSSAAAGATASSTSTKSASSASATSAVSDGAGDANQAARSAANLSKNYGKRQTDVADDTGDSIGSDNCDASGNSGGVNLSLLSNLLNGLLSGFSRRSEGAEFTLDDNMVRRLLAEDGFERRQTATDGVTDDTTDAIGSGNCSASNNSGGINVSLLDNLLNGLLAGFSRRDVDPSAAALPEQDLQRRDVASGESASPLQARADFLPVWEEIKSLGNEYYHSGGDKRDLDTAPVEKRAANDADTPDFTPVWEAFRDLVDSGYDQAAAAAKQQRRDTDTPLKMDYKPLIKAGYKYGSQLFKSFTKTNAKRSGDFKPFVNAASNFAVTAIREMMAGAKKAN
ncbi:hypothetical protein BCV70DRAFT_71561 [Testicularia cyperi]|uniref:Uncharacterized protein n=1 Tax=Testicularia cyperi TaxID=1882483 RepID=A0A317XVA8_9BASI|nr:hypothetical protein BCV70DRAFT_71561 [Testicularia cyperi]